MIRTQENTEELRVEVERLRKEVAELRYAVKLALERITSIERGKRDP